LTAARAMALAFTAWSALWAEFIAAEDTIAVLVE
jgi:hypothetical protein